MCEEGVKPQFLNPWAIKSLMLHVFILVLVVLRKKLMGRLPLVCHFDTQFNQSLSEPFLPADLSRCCF